MFLRLRFAYVALASFVPVLTVFVGCSDDDGTAPSTNDGGVDAKPDVSVVVTNEGESKQSGKIIVAQTTDEGVPSATVTVAGKSVLTNEKGDYEVIVPRNVPYRMTVVADGFYKLLEQEWILKQPTYVRSSTNLLRTETANLLAGLLPSRKAEKGIVVVKVNPLPPCDSEEGSTLTIDPPGEAKIGYFSGPLPSSEQTSVKGGTALSAAFYDVEVGVPLKVSVHSPKCLQAPFPVDVGDVTYTGNLTAEAGEALAYVRVYVRDPSVNDAGSD